MAAPNYNVYGTIRSDIPHEIFPGANQNPGGTILWNNVRIPPQGVFTIGWGASMYYFLFLGGGGGGGVIH